MTQMTSPTAAEWPIEGHEVDAFYGHPGSPEWELHNLVLVPVPWLLYENGIPIPPHVRFHKKAAPALERVFKTLWKLAKEDQNVINFWGLNEFSGSYVYRHMVGGSHLSMHAYGCAIDFDAGRNCFGCVPRFRQFPEVLAAFQSEGAVWGGHWQKPDGMHWQFARVHPYDYAPRKVFAITTFEAIDKPIVPTHIPTKVPQAPSVQNQRSENMDKVFGVLRHLVGFSGGIFAALGWVSSTDLTSFATNANTLLGALGGIVAIATSVYAKVKATGLNNILNG